MNNKSKLIKDILVTLITNNQLPTDMTKLDEQIFDEALKINEKELEDKANHHALGQYLSMYPSEMSYEDITKRLSNNNLEDDYGETIINIWEPFENKEPSEVAMYIEDCKQATLSLLKEIFE
jgi:hypothetical protein